ncbi:MAG: hypothetical protein E6L03_05295 [Thaumarchaeota archaeon]|nr:MAG: hypothetical protein E6L03_05295 [Nitrososphaerota archaeon]
MTNATSGEEQKQTGGGGEKQTKGAEETNLTNATSGEEQKQTGGGGGGETTTSAPNAKAAKTPEESLNTTNVTSLLNATDSKGGNDNLDDGG